MLILPENLKFRCRLLIWMAALLLILHAIYIPFMLLYSHTAGDFRAQALSVVLKILLPILSILSKSVLYGILLTVYDNYESPMTLPYTAAGIISLLITRIGELINYAYTNVNLRFDDVKAFVYSLITNFAIDTAIILILFIISRMSKPKKISRVFLLALVLCSIPMLIALVQEAFFCKLSVEAIIAEADYGEAAFTAKEIFTLIWGFAKHILTALATFILIMFINQLILKKTKRRPVNEKN